MTFAVLPVKNSAHAMRRLASVLTAAERARLAWLLYRRTIDVLRSVERLDKVVVVSNEARVLDHAREGMEIIRESAQQSHSDSADKAAAWCVEHGAKRVLLVPIDIPLLGVDDVEQVLGSGDSNGEPGIVIVSSADGTGTNALLQSPPGVIPCRFGPGSSAAHRREAAMRGIDFTVANRPGLAFDLDEPADLISLAGRSHDGDIVRYLTDISAAERAAEFLAGRQTIENTRT